MAALEKKLVETVRQFPVLHDKSCDSASVGSVASVNQP